MAFARRHGGLVLALVAVLTLAPAVSIGQDQPKPMFRTKVDVVNILCTVMRGDTYVQNLSKEDFEVYEEGVRQEIRYFHFESGEDAQPLNIVVLVDTSGSVKDKLRFEQEAATAFLEETLRKGKDLAAIVQFDSEINLVQDFTYDVAKLSNAVDGIRAGGATKLYDAIWVAVEQLLREEVGRKALVVLSDGADTQSSITEQDAVRVAQENDVVIFGIGVRGGNAPSDFGKLKDFAKGTGGLFFNSKAKLEELRVAFSKINSAVKNQYSIGYVSSYRVRDGSFRRIDVRIKERGLKLSHRKGYYSAKPGS